MCVCVCVCVCVFVVDESFILPMEDKFFMQLYSPEVWEAVPNTR